MKRKWLILWIVCLFGLVACGKDPAANNKKLTAMSECATMPDPDLIVRDNAYWLWFAVWNWDYIVKNGSKELSDAYTSFPMMEKVYNSEVMITRDELPDFSQYDSKEN